MQFLFIASTLAYALRLMAKLMHMDWCWGDNQWKNGMSLSFWQPYYLMTHGTFKPNLIFKYLN